MTPPTIAIDLGEMTPARQVGPGGHWPAWERLRHRLGRTPWLLVLAAAITAGTLLTATAAAPPPASALVRHFHVHADFTAHDRQHLFAASSQHDRTLVTAYRFADGTVAWQRSYPASGGHFSVWSYDGVLVFMTLQEDPDRGLDELVFGLDPATGDERWQSSGGQPVGMVNGRVLVHRTLPDPPDRPEEAPTRDLLAIDAATGEIAWQVGTGGRSLQIDPTGSGRLFVLDQAGTLTAYDARTGQQLASTATGAEVGTTNLFLDPAAATVIVRHVWLGELTVAGYHTTDLTPQWTFTEQVEAGTAGDGTLLQQCGPLLCSYSGGAIQGIDPATGRPQWSASGIEVSEGAWITGYRLDHPALAGHLAINASADSGGQQWLVAAESGELVLELGDWHVQPGSPELGDPVLATTNPDLQRHQDLTWVGRLRPDLSRVDPLGAIPGSRWCQVHTYSNQYLICLPAHDGPEPLPTTVWRVQG